MFEENDILVELEVALHDKLEYELLTYMNQNLDYIIDVMNKVMVTIKQDLTFRDGSLSEESQRILHLYYTLINLWNSRN
jgi:hypothetical protein